MKFVAVLGVLAMQCAVIKSWTGDNSSDETFCLFGWFGYLKRLLLIVLMLSGVILYYVPESRPHARRACYVFVDFAASRLKSALNANENEYMYEKIKSKYHRARYEQSLATYKHLLRDVRDDSASKRRSHVNATKTLTDVDGSTGEHDKRKPNSRRGKDEKSRRQSHYQLRSVSAKEMSTEPSKDVVVPTYFYPEQSDEIQKYLKPRYYDGGRRSGVNLENYGFLISGSPQQMALIDEKYQNDDVLFLREPYLNVEYKECGTSTDKMVILKPEAVSLSEQEGPTRDHDDYGMEAYTCKKLESISVPETNVSNYEKYSPSRLASQYDCGGGCCGANDCSLSLIEFDEKMSQDVINSGMHKNKSDITKDLRVDGYSDQIRVKSHGLSNEHKVNFRQESLKQRVETKAPQKGDQIVRPCESILKSVHRMKPKKGNIPTATCCKNDSYFTDRGGEADDENSQRGGRLTARHDLDERPQRESRYAKNSDDSLLFGYNYEDHHYAPAPNKTKPALLRAVNWIFGGCPEASRRAQQRRMEVGKEESREIVDEWLR